MFTKPIITRALLATLWFTTVAGCGTGQRGNATQSEAQLAARASEARPQYNVTLDPFPSTQAKAVSPSAQTEAVSLDVPSEAEPPESQAELAPPEPQTEPALTSPDTQSRPAIALTQRETRVETVAAAPPKPQSTVKPKPQRSDETAPPRSSKTMFEAIRESFDAQSEIGDELSGQERDNLSKMTEEANEYWKQLKADNLEAIRQANRQVPGVRWPAPNIILIVTDDLGYGDLGCYGQERIKTPHLDALAAEGVRYTNYYAGSPQDVPSRCSLATGLHTGHTRIRGNEPVVPLQPDDCTVAEVLWRAGYTTALVGRWALGDADTTGAPNRQGFEYSLTFANRNATPADTSPKLLLNGQPFDPAEHDDGPAETYPPAIVTNEALRVLASDCPRPLFLQINYPLPSATVHAVPGSTDYDAEDWPAAQKSHAQIVTRLDSEVGRIIDFVKASPERDDYIIIFTSDNGPQGEGVDSAPLKSAGPFRAAQGQLWEGGIRVPMIVWAAQNDRTDRVDGRPWAAWDLLPTLAELAGAIRQPAALDGISQVVLLSSDEQLAVVEVEQTELIVEDQAEPADAEPTEAPVEQPSDLGVDEQPELEVEEQPEVAEVEVTQIEVQPVAGIDGLPVHTYLYWEIHEPAFQQAIRAGRWKGIRTGLDGPLALYDLAADAAETTDVSAANPEVVQRLTAWLDAARTPSPNWPVRGEP